MPTAPILALNCGSSSIKFAAFDAGATPLPRVPLWSGKVQGIGGPTPVLEASGRAPQALTLDAEHPTTAALAHIRTHVAERLAGGQPAAVAHRVVHGGARHFAPLRAGARHARAGQ